MLSLEELCQRPELVQEIDWEITPRQAFEAYQLRSVDNWRHGSLDPVLYFYVSCWRGENKVFLLRRSLKHSEDVAQVEAPPEMVAACCSSQEGEMMPKGQAMLSDELRAWLQAKLS